MTRIENNIIETMMQEYNTFTKSEKKIIDYIMNHKKEAQYISITDLSTACKVAVSTISVFCRKLDLDGFNDFKLELAKATMSLTNDTSFESGEISNNDSVSQVMEKTYHHNQSSLLDTFRLTNASSIELAVDLISQAKQVVCLGQGNHSLVASAAWSSFSTMSSKFKIMLDSHFQAMSVATLNEGDAVIYFSYSGSTHELLDIADIIKKRKVKLILVTRFSKSPGAAYADALLICGSDENPLLYGSIPALIAQLYIVDVLYNEFCIRNAESSEHTRERVAKILARKTI